MTGALRIGVAGLGVVGGGAMEILARDHEAVSRAAGRPIVITAVCARNRGKDRGFPLNDVAWFDDPVALANFRHIDVFIEAIGGEEGSARESVAAAAAAGKHIVTANKALLAKHGEALIALMAPDAFLGFEAATVAGVPIIKIMRDTLSFQHVEEVAGILNGTCNFILTQMEETGEPFESCLAEAQKRGYAELDPALDVGGHDAAHKLILLSALGFAAPINDAKIPVAGVSEITPNDIAFARFLGFRIKLLGVARRTVHGILRYVGPTLIPESSAFAGVNGVQNAVRVRATPGGEILLAGPGAGKEATGGAIVSDLIDVARGARLPTLGRERFLGDAPPRYITPDADPDHAFYVRLQAPDVAQRLRLEEALKARRGQTQTFIKKDGAQEPDEATMAASLIVSGLSQEEVATAVAETRREKILANAPLILPIDERL